MPYLVERVMLTGDVLSDARVSIGQFNDPYVSIKFDQRGAQFERITGENVKKRMAIVLDNTIYSAPVIQERISGGQAQITGHVFDQEANDLAIVLRAGALPAPRQDYPGPHGGPITRTGFDRQRGHSTLIAGAMVVIFMIVYYRLSGAIADFALALNRHLSARGIVCIECHVDPAWNRRDRADHRHGGRLECLDFRADSRGITPRQSGKIGSR